MAGFVSVVDSLRLQPAWTHRSNQTALTVMMWSLLGGGGAAAFTPGNLVIYRIGNGTDALSNFGNPVFLDEYTPTGTLVQSVPLPTTASGANRRLISSSIVQEGMLTRSSDGRYLILTGYDADRPYSGNL